MSYKTRRTRTKTHITIFLALLFIILSKIASTDLESNNQRTYKFQVKSYTNLQWQLLETLQIAVKLLRSQHLMKKPAKIQTTVVFLLILLSNDVNLNPGPKKATATASEKCFLCNKPVSSENSVQCYTCNLWYHIDCSKSDLNNYTHPNFQWICPSPNCRPNFEQGNQQISNIVSPNKYDVLIRENTVKPLPQVKKKTALTERKPFKPRIKSNQYTELFKELPKISSSYYIGKDLCGRCFKEVRENQHGIHCDRCERWIHRSCSDMSIRIYNQCMKKKSFKWACNNCRKDDEVIIDKADVTKLEEMHRPERWEKIVKAGKEMLIIHMNCRSILNKEEELKNIVEDLDPDIITLSETWLGDHIPAQTCVPDGYKIIRKDRSDDFKQKYGRNRGGGVAVLYKQHIKVEKNRYTTDQVEEILWCQVKMRESFMLGVVYRAEYTDIIEDKEEENKLEENIRKVTELSDKIILTGDFNIDLLEETNRNTELLKGIYETHGLKQHVSKPTRIDKSTSKPTLIDHIWESEDAKIIKSTGTFVALSDHLGQYAKLNLKKQSEPRMKIKFRNFKNYDVDAFNAELQRNINTSQINEYLQTSDINLATETLVKIIQDTAESHAPLTEKTLNNQKKNIPWFTKELKDMIKSKNELIQDLYSHGIQSYKKRITTLSNKITQLKRNLKEKFITEKLEEAQNNSKKCWNILSTVTNRIKVKETIEPEIRNQDKANEYNRFFATVGIEIQKKLGINCQPTSQID